MNNHAPDQAEIVGDSIDALLHPMCKLFPRMSGAEFEALKSDIAANGLRQPIVFHKGLILDGGNRYQACMELDIDPENVDYTGDDLVGFVLSANLHRRHLTPGQQAAIVASAQDWTTAQTVGKPKANPVTLPDYAPADQSGHATGLRADQAAEIPLATVADRAALSGASEKTQRNADKVARADPDLARQVAHGAISLPAAVAKIEGKPENPAPKPKPAKPAAPVEPPDDGQTDAERAADLAGELELEVAKNADLHEQLAAVTNTDQAKELVRLIGERNHAHAHAKSLNNTLAVAQDTMAVQRRCLSDIRTFLGTTTHRETMDALRTLKGGA